MTPEQVIARIAEVAHAVSVQSGEAGVDMAGYLVSFLAANPEHVDRFLQEGAELLIDGTFEFHKGCLSYRCVNGEIHSADHGRSIRGASN